MLVKETISGRKNTSPQNLYETTQLYAAGALKVACIGLQCIGFNNVLYRTICAQTGKWNAATDAAGENDTGIVLGASGGLWNSSAGYEHGPAGKIGGIGVNRLAGGDENVPPGRVMQ